MSLIKEITIEIVLFCLLLKEEDDSDDSTEEEESDETEDSVEESGHISSEFKRTLNIWIQTSVECQEK